MLAEFSKDKVFWTKKMNLKLVKFMESRPNIWHPKHPKYTSLKVKDQTYAEFAAKYGHEFTGEAVKNRWTNIRSTFANYSRKLAASRAKGEEYKISWPLWEACQFLSKVNKKLKLENLVKEEYGEESTDLSIYLEDQEWSNDILETQPTSCDNIAKSLLTVFSKVQNDAFGIDNTKHGDIGRLVSARLSMMNSFEAAQMSTKIMEILLLYDKNNPDNHLNA